MSCENACLGSLHRPDCHPRLLRRQPRLQRCLECGGVWDGSVHVVANSLAHFGLVHGRDFGFADVTFSSEDEARYTRGFSLATQYSSLEWTLVNNALAKQSVILRSGTRFVWVPHGSCCYSISTDSTSLRHAAIFTPSREMADLIMRFWPGVAVGVATSRQARAFAVQMGSSFSIVSPWCRGAPVCHGTCSSGPSGPRLRSFLFLLRRLALSD